MNRNHLEFLLASTATSLEPSEFNPKAASPLLHVRTMSYSPNSDHFGVSLCQDTVIDLGGRLRDGTGHELEAEE
jgi:hypothetical protein